MAAPPLSQRGLDATLPSEVRDSAAPQVSGDQIVVEYTADRQLSINRQSVAPQGLATRLREIYVKRRDKTLYVAAAGALRYGDVVAVIDAARGAGVERIGVITDGMRRVAPGGA